MANHISLLYVSTAIDSLHNPMLARLISLAPLLKMINFNVIMDELSYAQ